jgi:hypothetical protein
MVSENASGKNDSQPYQYLRVLAVRWLINLFYGKLPIVPLSEILD